MAPRNQRKPRIDGVRSRQQILEAAAAMATTVGLDGLSFGGLADAVGMSKGGVSAHFPSKLDLQLATIDAAFEIFQREVLAPGLAAPPGVPRLRATCHADLAYIHNRVFPGGCFFSAASAEFCARPGRVKERLLEINRGWMQLLVTMIEDGRARGEVRPDVDADQLAFELHGLMVTANFETMLRDDPAVLEVARRSIDARIDAAG